MFVTLLSAAVVGIAHHIFLSILDDKRVDMFPFPQPWIRDVGNALSHVVQILLELSVGIALTQSVRYYVIQRAAALLTPVADLVLRETVQRIPWRD